MTALSQVETGSVTMTSSSYYVAKTAPVGPVGSRTSALIMNVYVPAGMPPAKVTCLVVALIDGWPI